MENPKIDILIATYNGGEFIKEQLESIINQTYTNWLVIIRDDDSIDNTKEIIRSYKKKYPGKIRIINDNNRNLGVVKNFSCLLSQSSSEYIMFCDQDDVWLPDKIEKTLIKMLKIEKQNKNVPILVHTDLKVTDEKLNIISDSFYSYQKLNPYNKSLSRLLIQNNVTGCTVMINKLLRDASLPFPEKIIIHDWYLAIIASYKGIIEYIPEPTLLYRQHERNTIGTNKFTTMDIINKIFEIRWVFFPNHKMKNSSYRNIIICMEQAGDFKDNETAIIFSRLPAYNWIMRRFYILKYGFYKYGFLKNVALFIVI